MSDCWLLPWAKPCAENLGVCNPLLADAETLGSPPCLGALLWGCRRKGWECLANHGSSSPQVYQVGLGEEEIRDLETSARWLWGAGSAANGVSCCPVSHSSSLQPGVTHPPSPASSQVTVWIRSSLPFRNTDQLSSLECHHGLSPLCSSTFRTVR